jgi:ProP effector
MINNINPDSSAEPTLAPIKNVTVASAVTSVKAMVSKNQQKPRGFDPKLDAMLKQLSQLYPHLFGALIKPLKRGIYHDILLDQPTAIDAQILKIVLAHHTRSTRYLSAVADGLPRFSLLNESIEAMAPEHIYYALHEIYRRRQLRSSENLNPALVLQIIALFDKSELTKAEFDALLRTKNATQNSILDECLAALSQRSAKDQALVHAFESTNLDNIQDFSDMYGLHPKTVEMAMIRVEKEKSINSVCVNL